VDLLSHPFRLTPDGLVATVADGSDDADAEAIAVLASTRRGERELVPDFGITDPVYGDLSLAELNAGLDTFGPELRVTDVATDYPTDTTATTVITYEEAG
jgi:hypothetical protein